MEEKSRHEMVSKLMSNPKTLMIRIPSTHKVEIALDTSTMFKNLDPSQQYHHSVCADVTYKKLSLRDSARTARRSDVILKYVKNLCKHISVRIDLARNDVYLRIFNLPKSVWERDKQVIERALLEILKRVSTIPELLPCAEK